MLNISTVNDLEILRQQLQAERNKIQTTIITCAGTGCQASSSRAVLDYFRPLQEYLEKENAAKH